MELTPSGMITERLVPTKMPAPKIESCLILD